MLSDSGLVRSKSRKRSDAIVAIKKQPGVVTSKDDSGDRIRSSQAAKIARGTGDAADRSKGIPVCVSRKSETVWL